MTPPKKIYIYPSNMGDGLVRTWFDFHMTKDSLPYFSEQAIRETGFAILDQVCKSLRSNYGISINSANITEDIIRVLKGGNND